MDYAKRWRQKSVYYRLQGQRHRESGAVRFPPRPALPTEPADVWEPCALSGSGELYSFSGVRQAPTMFAGNVPYLVGIVKLAEGPLVTAQLTDCTEADLQIGMPVEMVTRRLGDADDDGLLVYGYKFRPVLGSI